MTDMNNAPEQAQPTAIDDSPLSQAEAFRAMTEKPATQPEGDDGAAEQNSADDADAATPEGEPSGDDTGQDDTGDDLQPIEPPASWTKEEKKAWESLPRDLQESLADRERARRADVDRRLNDAAKQSQAAQAKEQAAEQARKHFEEQLPVLQQAIHQQFAAEFSDVTSWDDVQRMAAEDPIRYNRWQAMREQSREVSVQVQAAQQRQQAETANQVREFFQEQSRLFVEKVPEFANPQKAVELRKQAFDTLTELGFEAEDINAAWNSGGHIPVHDHRFQLLVHKASLYDKAQKAVKNPVSKPAPQVQRPGPASSTKDQRSEQVKTLDQKLSRTGSRQDAFALMKAMSARG